ncbi:MAG: hypothetical protein WD065_16400, partial [Planctomycetaceae bacterium]
ITTKLKADEVMETVPHNLAEFFDNGFKPEAMTQTIMMQTSGLWEEDGDGEGHLILLGDVVFLRQTQTVHREVEGLLAALRNHGRQTFTLEPAQHETLRRNLEKLVSVDDKDTALYVAVREAAKQADVNIRLDMAALADEGISEREPVTFRLADQPLSIVLTAMLAKYQLTYLLQDGVTVITTKLKAEETLKTAVYDVRDLSRNDVEAVALRRAVFSQTQGFWEEEGSGEGTITFAKPGAMVVRQTENVHAELLTLLENYRAALKVSKPRDRDEVDRQEILTLYYRLPTLMVGDLEILIRKTIAPDSWQDIEQPQGIGSIAIAKSLPEMHDNGSAPYLDYSVMIIKQTRENHEKIVLLNQKVQYGDYLTTPFSKGGMGMGGMGGGGFGGGFGGGMFSLPAKPDK